VQSDQLADIVEESLDETGAGEIREGHEQIVARLDPTSKVQRREKASSGPTLLSFTSSTPRAARVCASGPNRRGSRAPPCSHRLRFRGMSTSRSLRLRG
jgi:hypothetical protein